MCYPCPCGKYEIGRCPVCPPMEALLERSASTGSSKVMKFMYFDLFAKGPAAALALSFSGLEWEGSCDFTWSELKPRTPWRELPVLEVPDVGMIGHELAILNFIASESPKMAGADQKERVISSQLMSEAEDIYQKLIKVQPTCKNTAEKVPREELDKMWSDTDQAGHNRSFGFHVFLQLLEDYYKTVGKDGKFTLLGTTVGECKLFASLHSLKMIQDSILDNYPGLAAFHMRFANLPETVDILSTGGKMGKPFQQYFLAVA
eukprot:TRINITY_DN83595_c0_g1_i1.p1 TRINITY_DN83595_c0_g1~~TRINITY_DN83595_c0_g1_i1.p1  ORF type:complete len:261 (-),score=55.63 TRINITY_DN83595_c0_g1_i1:202-984(-)